MRAVLQVAKPTSRSAIWCMGNAPMAQAAEKYEDAENVRYPSKTVLMDSSVPGRLDRAARCAMDALVGTKQSLADAYCRAQPYAVDTFARLASRSSDFGRRVSGRADRIRREHPLQLLAVIGGAAIALGIVARVRRSRHYGYRYQQ